MNALRVPRSLRTTLRGACCAALAAVLLIPTCLPAADDVVTDQAFEKRATWQAPAAAQVREQLLALIKDKELDQVQRQAIEADWSNAETWTTPSLVLQHLATALAAIDPRAKEVVDLCTRPREQVVLPAFDFLSEDQTPALERHNLRLLLGHWLVGERLIDEALLQLEPLKADDVVDPATLLFNQAVVYHATLMKKPGLEAIGKLLEREKEIPRRYTSLVKLMEADLSPLKDDSLDHIARRMDDIHRRLDLGRAGPKVREVEDGVIKSLDKLIEEMESQAAAAAAAMAAASGRGSIRSDSPAPDSMPLGGKGPGRVDKKDIGHESGWGELPPKERQEAMQQIGKDFPSHYRDVIEQYFRKLANEDTKRR